MMMIDVLRPLQIPKWWSNPVLSHYIPRYLIHIELAPLLYRAKNAFCVFGALVFHVYCGSLNVYPCSVYPAVSSVAAFADTTTLCTTASMLEWLRNLLPHHSQGSSTERWSRNTLRVVTARVFYVLMGSLSSPFIFNNSVETATPFNVVSHPRCSEPRN